MRGYDGDNAIPSCGLWWYPGLCSELENTVKRVIDASVYIPLQGQLETTARRYGAYEEMRVCEVLQQQVEQEGI